MLRTTLPHLLILIVLICPYLCLGEEAGEDGAACATICSCASERDSSRHESPGPPLDYDPTCLCHGAIVVQLTTVEVDHSNPLLDWHGDTTVALAKCPILASVSFESPHQFPPFSSGRDVCALTCAFLL